jgi:tungstate transport system substrate-binding protein
MLRLVIVLGLILLLASACGDSNELILATTTSTNDSGLLDVIVPAFEKEAGYEVKTIAVGSGQALRLGEEGEADVILAHSPKSEEEFIAAGFGIERQPVMHNDFVIVGPPDDPASISGETQASEAFALVAESEAIFISRGDESGTHNKELGLWEKVGVKTEGVSWYQVIGQGMSATLHVANEKRGYTLSDRGTYLSQKDNLDLEILVEGDAALFNPYTVMVVNPEKHSKVNVVGARAFARFLVSSQGQDLIRTFGMKEFGEPLFVPDAFVDATPAPSRP